MTLKRYFKSQRNKTVSYTHLGGLFDSVRTLSVHMYVLSSEGLHIDKTYATAVVLLVIVIGINALSSFVAKKITKKQG